MRVAIVHDWLLGMRGGERCLEVLCELFPEAEIFTTFYEPANITETITSRTVHVSALQGLPQVRRYYRYLLPFYPYAARSLSRSLARRHREQQFDLVLSVSHCLAKNVSAPPGVFHLSYCLTPMRYIWDQYEAYFGGRTLEPLYALVAKQLRQWDVERSRPVDHYIGISRFVARRIKDLYRRDADVIYPPVRTDWIRARSDDDGGDGFLCVNALVPYKNVEVIVRAFSRLPHKLTIVGKGPERARLDRLAAGANVTFLSDVSDARLAELYRSSKALIFAAEEDFGMAPVEMQAAVRPVIAYGKGGSLETVDATSNSPTGIFFDALTPKAIVEAIESFNRRQPEFTVDNCLKNAELFSRERFQEGLLKLLADKGFDLGRAGLSGQDATGRRAAGA